MSNTREKLLSKIKQILIGPDPLDQFKQDNGEEILFSDSPLKTYVTGVLFPQMLTVSELQEESGEYNGTEEESEIPFQDAGVPDSKAKADPLSTKNYAEIVAEAETSKINNYKQSAMGITLCIPNAADRITISISVGSYDEKESIYPREKRDEDGNVSIVMSERTKKCYFRKQIDSDLVIPRSDLPSETTRFISDKYVLTDKDGNAIKGLGIAITYRMRDVETAGTIYTVTLINTNKTKDVFPKVSECWFQVEFSVNCDLPVNPLPDNFCAEIQDEDYQLNSLLYREVKTFGIGHGCAATWDDSV